MKNSLAILISIIVSLGVFVVASPKAKAGFISKGPSYLGLNLGLVGYWSLDGPDMSGNTAKDKSGNNNNGTLTNGPVRTIGKVGQALSFDGTDDYVDFGSATNLSTSSPQTVSLWFKLKGLAVADRPTIFGYGQPSGSLISQFIFGFNVVGLGPTEGTGRLNFIDYSGTLVSGAYTTKDYSSPLDTNWHHAVGMWDGSTWRIFVDGVEDTNAEGTQDAPSTGGSMKLIAGSNAPSTARFLNGLIDEVRIYNRALSADQIRRLYSIGLGTTQNRSQTKTSLDQGLVGYWTLDGPDMSGNTAKDRSGNNNNGTLTNGPVRTTGKVGQALSFDGVDDNVSVSDSALFNFTNKFTVCAWVQPKETGRGDYVTKWQDGQATFNLLQGVTTGKFQFYVSMNGLYTDIPNSGTSATSITIGVWYFICGRYDGANVSIFVNGVLENQNAETRSVFDGTSPVALGMTSGDSVTNYDGLIDDARIYNRSLSADEVRRLYEMSRPKFNVSKTDSLTQGLVGYWTLDGPDMSGNTAKDRSGNNNNGTLTNGPVRTTGKVGQALSFDGTDDYVNLSNAPALDFTTVYTLSAWIRKITSDDYNPILIRGSGDADDIELYLSDSGAQGLTIAHNRGNGGTFEFSTNNSFVGVSGNGNWGTPSINEWVHLVVTYNGDAWRVYYNGVQQGNTVTGAVNPLDTDKPWRIGWAQHSAFAGATDVNFDGLIDEVRIYNRALSADEVRKLYEMGR